MEKHLRTYFLDHGSFYSAAPTPATVPGLASLGDAGSFTATGGWSAIGAPVANGASVNFSYQAFAGQTPNGSTTPVVNDYLNDPTTNMNLIRRTSSAYNYRFPHSAGIASTEEKLRFDWSDFSFCAQAATDYEACIDEACKGDQGDADCIAKNCVGKDGEPSGGKTAVQNCEAACTAIGHSVDDCNKACGEPSDTKCNTENVADIDCYHADSDSSGKTAAQNCKAGCIEQNGGDPAYGEKCEIACGESSDGKCNSGNAADIDCYSDDSSVCSSKCMDLKEGDKAECLKACEAGDKWPSDGKCFDTADTQDPDCAGRDSIDANPCADGVLNHQDGSCSSAGGGSSSDSGENSGSGGGDAGGGSESGDGSTSGDDSGSVSSSNAECASFGISKATDFGIQTNVPGYNWVVTTAVGNFSPGSECTLVAMVIQVVGGQTSKTDFIKINMGE